MPTTPYFLPPHSATRSILAIWLAAVFAPIVIFYAAAIALARNLPMLDDYDAGINFALELQRRHTFLSRLIFYLGRQHNEYKLFFAEAIVWIELNLTGKLDFRFLSVLGALSVLILGFFCWKLFLPQEKSLSRRLALFLPVSFLVFQLGYWETIDWALPGLQNLPVLGFVVGTFYLLDRQSRASYFAGLVFLTLAITSSGNGLFAIPLALLILILQKSLLKSLGLLLVSAACVAAYFFHFVPTSLNRPLLQALLHPRWAFFFSFLGSITSYQLQQGAIPLGVVAFLYTIFLVTRGLLRRSLAISCCVAFVLTTALAVAGTRSTLGMAGSLSGRYQIYSFVFLALLWMASLTCFPSLRDKPLRHNYSYIAFAVMTGVLCLGRDARGIKSMQARNQDLLAGIAMFEHPTPQEPGPLVATDPEREAFRARIAPSLAEAIRQGLYEPPSVPPPPQAMTP